MGSTSRKVPKKSGKISGQKASKAVSNVGSDLIDNETFLSEVFASVQDGISVLDTEQNILRVNAIMEKWYAHAMPMVGRKCYEVYHGRTSRCEICPTSRTLQTGRAEYDVVPKHSADGKIVGWQDLYSFPLTDSKTGKIKGVIEYVRDISARKQAEDALRVSEERYRTIFDNSPHTVVLLDAGGMVIDVNQTALDVVGYRKEDIVGRHFSKLPILPEESRRKAMDIFGQRQQGQKIAPYEVQYTTKDGRLLSGYTYSATLQDADGKYAGVVLMISDTTYIRELEKQFHHAQKMESIGRLAGGIAHDFNNLLSAIMGFSELLMTEMHNEDPRRHDVEEIKNAAKRAGALTHQLLAFSRKQVIEFTSVDLNALVENMGKMLKRMIGEDVDLEFALAPSVSRINADAGQIEQVLANLVVNARDAMQAGGKLKIETADITLKHQDVIQMPESRLGQFVVLTVSDTGMGISEEILNHIFEPFFTTKDKEEGTGLGLATVYGIVKQHRGWIRVESKVGKGSKFSIYLPVAVAKTETAKDSGGMARGQKVAGRRILLVEDDNGLREMMKRLLVKEGSKVETACDAETAREIFNSKGKEFDLLISDVVLAGQSGVDLAEYVVIRKPEMRILLCSGYSDKRARHDTIKGKGFRFLQKPFTADGLLNAVHETMK